MITEIAPNVYRLESVFGGRLLYQYLLAGDRCVLIDTGVSTTPHEIILPSLERLGIPAERVALVVVTHSDYDHQGGNHAIKAACPQALLSCGKLDQPLVGDPQQLFARRYNAYRADHDIGYDDATKAAILDYAGPAQPLDLTWTGGETFAITANWEVELLHVPGHTHGHLSLYDQRNSALYTGDAVHWSYYPGAEDSRSTLPPTYLYVNSYLNTIRALGLLETTMLAGAHWPLQRGDEVAAFLSESRSFVERTDQAILDELHRAAESLTLREIIERVGPRIGDWPEAINIELVYALAGHMERLVSNAQVAQIADSHPIQYRLP